MSIYIHIYICIYIERERRTRGAAARDASTVQYSKKYDDRAFNNTNNISRNINQYNTDVVNNYKFITA